MKRLSRLSFLIAIASVICIVGCEFESTSSGDAINERNNFANFAGVYRPPEGRTFLVALPGPVTSTPAAQVDRGDSIGTGNGIQASFGATLSNVPVSLGTLFVTDGTESFVDGGNGVLVGSDGGTGTINYETGAITVNFFLAPGVGQSVIVTYKSIQEGAPGNEERGSSRSIYTFSVVQEGNRLIITDNNGATYRGSYGIVATVGGDQTGRSSGEVIAPFEVTGTDARGNTIRITGSFRGDYVAPTSDLTDSGVLANRSIQGVWIEGGIQGDLLGTSGSTDVLIPTFINDEAQTNNTANAALQNFANDQNNSALNQQ